MTCKLPTLSAIYHYFLVPTLARSLVCWSRTSLYAPEPETRRMLLHIHKAIFGYQIEDFQVHKPT